MNCQLKQSMLIQKSNYKFGLIGSPGGWGGGGLQGEPGTQCEGTYTEQILQATLTV